MSLTGFSTGMGNHKKGKHSRLPRFPAEPVAAAATHMRGRRSSQRPRTPFQPGLAAMRSCNGQGL
jgi:hypothetical protein